MKIVAVYNGKGGVAKTITAVSVAALLAARGRRVMVIDTDGQFAATSYFTNLAERNAERNGDGAQAGVFDLLIEGASLESAAELVDEGLLLVAADPRMVSADRHLHDLEAPDLRLTNALKSSDSKVLGARVAGRLEYCIIDVPSGYGPLARNALLACTHLVVPVNNDTAAIDCATDTVTRLEKLCSSYGRKPPKVRYLLTEHRSTVHSAEIAAEVEETWPGQVFKTRIRYTEHLRRMTRTRRTVAAVAGGTAREDYVNLVEEIERWR